jgi:hypothetical protein
MYCVIFFRAKYPIYNSSNHNIDYLNAFDGNGDVRNVIVVDLGDGLVDATPFPIFGDDALKAFFVND